MNARLRLVALALALLLPLQLGTAWALSASMWLGGAAHSHAPPVVSDDTGNPHAGLWAAGHDGVDPHCPHALRMSSDESAVSKPPCLDCGFCLAASVAFAGSAITSPVIAGTGVMYALERPGSEGIAVIPPDPPPIA